MLTLSTDIQELRAAVASVPDITKDNAAEALHALLLALPDGEEKRFLLMLCAVLDNNFVVLL